MTVADTRCAGPENEPPTAVGLFAPISYPTGLPPADKVIGFARAVDEGPFDSLWVGDHLLWHGPFLEATTTLAALAAVTARVTIGTNVYLIGLRPSLVSARTLGTVDYLSGGRLVLGVGMGGDNPKEFEALGLDVGRRRQLYEVAMADVFRWWDGTEGVSGQSVEPSPQGSIPLWMGGRSEAAIRRAVEGGATAWSAHLMTVDRLRQSAEALDALAAAAAVPKPKVAVTVFVDVCSRTRCHVGGMEFMTRHFATSDASKIAQYVITGDVEGCVEQLASYAQVADHIVVFVASDAPWEHMDDLAEIAGRVRTVRRRGGA